MDNSLFKCIPILNNDYLQINNIDLPEDINKINKFKNEILYIQLSDDDINSFLNNMKKYKTHHVEETIIECDIKKINNAWKKTNYYIPENFNEIKNKMKYLNSRKDLIGNEITKPPEIYFENNYIMFYDGRNRFSNFRDLGCERMPFIIEKSQEKLIIEKF